MSKRSKLAKINKEDKVISRSEKLLMWLGNRLGVQVKKTDTKVTSFVYEPRPTIRKPLFDYVNLFEVATTSWVLRRAFNAKIQEATRNRWKIVAKFKYKCSNLNCSKEFNITPKDEICDACGSKVQLPNQQQYLKAVKLIEEPNPDYRFDDFTRSSMFYDCSLDDWYWCYDEETEILTEGGWKNHSQLDKGTKVASMNEDGKLIYSPIKNMFKREYNGTMVKVDSKSIDLLVTPNHRVYVKKSKGANKFYGYGLEKIDSVFDKHVKYKKDVIWEGKERETFILKGTDRKEDIELNMDNFIEFLGYFISEGHSDLYRVNIAQKKTSVREKIESNIISLNFSYSKNENGFRVYDSRLAKYLGKLGKSWEKYIPKEFLCLSKRQLKILFDSLMHGDGNKKKTIYSTSSKRLADDFQELLFKLGLSGNIGFLDRVKPNGIIKHKEYLVYISYRNFEPSVNHHRNYGAKNYLEEYRGIVWCPEVNPTHLIYVRRNGKAVWCGNSVVSHKVPKFDKGKIVINENKEMEYEIEPTEVYVEDARFIFPVSDEFGHLGGYEYYCNECYGRGDYKDQDQPVVAILPDTPEDEKERLMICPTCGSKLSRTSYVQEINGQIVARFTRDEIVHGSSSAVKPALFGMSKIISVWKIVNTVAAMDDYNWEVYSEGKVGSIIGFPGEDQVEIEEKKAAIENEIKKLDGQDIQSGRYKNSKKIRTLFLGLKEGQKPERIPIMENLKDMQSLDFYKVYLDAIGEMYGVTPRFEVTNEGRVSRVRVQVDPRATKELQNNFSDLWNSDVFPKFKITDWILVFNPTEEKDELGEAQTLQTKMAAVLTAARAGLQVNVAEDGRVTIQGEAKIVEGGVGEGSRMGEQPRDMLGKPENWTYGAASRTSGERRNLELMQKNILEKEDKGNVEPAPYYPSKKTKDTVEELDDILEETVKVYVKGKTKNKAIEEAKAKAEKIVDEAKDGLRLSAQRKASNRVGRKIELSEEYINRLERYKRDSLEDFEVILSDMLSRPKKDLSKWLKERNKKKIAKSEV